MELRVTRPAFITGSRHSRRTAALPHLGASSAGGQATGRRRTIRTVDASRQEMRSYRLRPVPRGVLLQGRRQALTYPVEQRAEGGADRELLRRQATGRSPTGTHAETGRPGAQGAASRVRDVEPGHPRPQRRGLRRLPHALQARGRDQDQRPRVRSPLLNVEPRLPDLPPVSGGARSRPGSRRSRIAPRRCSSAPRRPSRTCSTPSRRRRRRARPRRS